MNVVEQLQWRYATKKFDRDKKLEMNQVERLLQSFNLTATSYGLQPLKMVVVQDERIQENLVAASYNQRQVADASHLLVICIETEVNAQFVRTYFEHVKKIRETPEKILKPFREDLEQKFDAQSKAETKNWAAKQAYLALGNLLTVCALEEIDSCPMEGFQPDKYADILGLHDQNLEAVLVLPVGYRAEDDMFAEFKKVRRPLDESVVFFGKDESHI